MSQVSWSYSSTKYQPQQLWYWLYNCIRIDEINPSATPGIPKNTNNSLKCNKNSNKPFQWQYIYIYAFVQNLTSFLQLLPFQTLLPIGQYLNYLQIEFITKLSFINFSFNWNFKPSNTLTLYVTKELMAENKQLQTTALSKRADFSDRHTEKTHKNLRAPTLTG